MWPAKEVRCGAFTPLEVPLKLISIFHLHEVKTYASSFVLIINKRYWVPTFTPKCSYNFWQDEGCYLWDLWIQMTWTGKHCHLSEARKHQRRSRKNYCLSRTRDFFLKKIVTFELSITAQVIWVEILPFKRVWITSNNIDVLCVTLLEPNLPHKILVRIKWGEWTMYLALSSLDEWWVINITEKSISFSVDWLQLHICFWLLLLFFFLLELY